MSLKVNFELLGTSRIYGTLGAMKKNAVPLTNSRMLISLQCEIYLDLYGDRDLLFYIKC